MFRGPSGILKPIQADYLFITGCFYLTRVGRHSCGSRGRQRQLLSVGDALTLCYRVNSVGSDVAQHFHASARPANLYRVHDLALAQSKMKSEVVLRQIASATANFVELCHASAADGDTRADRGTIRACTDEPKQHSMSGTWDILHEKGGRFAYVQDENVDVAVIPHIAKCGSPPASQRSGGKSRRAGNIFKCAVAFVSKQRHRLPISRAVMDDGVHLGINMAAGDEHVQPSIVIKIHKACAPFHKGINSLTHFGAPTQVHESLRWSLVVI